MRGRCYILFFLVVFPGDVLADSPDELPVGITIKVGSGFGFSKYSGDQAFDILSQPFDVENTALLGATELKKSWLKCR